MDLEQLPVPPKLEYPPLKFLSEQYDGADIEFLEYLYSLYYHEEREKMFDRLEEATTQKKGHPVKLDRDRELDATEHYAIASAAMLAAAPQAEFTSDMGHRTFYRALRIIHRKGLVHNTDKEYTDISEFLIDKIEGVTPSSGKLYEIMLFLEHVIPILDRVPGFESEKMMAVRENFSRVIAVSPLIRDMTDRIVDIEDDYSKQVNRIKNQLVEAEDKLNTVTMQDPEWDELSKNADDIRSKLEVKTTEQNAVLQGERELFAEKFEKILEVVADKSLARPILGIKVGEIVNAQTPGTIRGSSGIIVYKEDGVLEKRYVHVVISTERYAGSISMGLRGIVDFQATDPEKIIKELGQLALKDERVQISLEEDAIKRRENHAPKK